MASLGIGERLRTARQALGLSLEEVETATRIRLAYYLALAEQAEPVLSQGTWLEQLEQEHANLSAALHWLLECKAAEEALRGQALDAERIAAAAEQAAEGADPPGDLNATPDYKRHLARVLCRRALEEAAA